MSDLDESDSRRADDLRHRSMQPLESNRGGVLSERDQLIARFLLLHRFIGNADLTAAHGELTRQDEESLLDLLVDRGLVTPELRSHVDGIVSELLSRGEPDVESTLGIADTLSRVTSLVESEQPEGQFGEYEIIEELAKGGMGVVYKARQTKLNRTVALKMIRAGEFANDKQIKRFYTEAEAAGKLDHPGIVPVYEVGEAAGRHFYSMAYIDGEGLNDRVKRDGPLQPRTAAEIIRDAARAVHHAHCAGVIHRDIKPGNILLDQSGNARVTDFGLAKLQRTDSELTKADQVLGTPAYMPPEQAAGNLADVGITADVYSLGATLYFLLTGRPPFQTANVADTLRQVIEADPVTPRKLDPSIPRDVETICLKCLRKECPSRYETAEALANDLQRWIEGEPIVARPVGRVERAWKWCQRKPVVAGLLATIVVMMIVGSIVFWERQNAMRAEGLVDSLVRAEPQQVPAIVAELERLDYWSTPRLREVLASDEESESAARARMHARIALASVDASVTDDLIADLMEAEWADIANLRDALNRADAPVAHKLWVEFRNVGESDAHRFRAGLALAGLVPEASQWTEAETNYLADELVETNSVYHPELWSLLDPIKDRLIGPLNVVFRDARRSESEHVAAANALGEFVSDDAERLMQCLLASTPSQFQILYPKFNRVATSNDLQHLSAIVSEEPAEVMLPQDRINLGRRRARAAIMLLRRGERESILDVMRYDNDPEAMTQFIHSCRRFGVEAVELIDCLEIVDEYRGPLAGNRIKADDTVMYALLLALGDYPYDEIAELDTALVARLAEIYASDPSSGVHSATGWLLRRWGMDDAVASVDRQVTVQDESGHREWYVMAIDVPPFEVQGEDQTVDKLYLTMIDFQPGEFQMGSPYGEPNRSDNEPRHREVIENRYSVCDREMTWLHTSAMEGDSIRQRFAQNAQGYPELDSPSFSLSWMETVQYCLWLSERAGIPKDERCYSRAGDASDGDLVMSLDQHGFRHPTEKEWEYACRASTSTAFFFGHDVQWLDQYAWYSKNSGDWSHPVAELRPNPRGLFDVYGNAHEWCFDWYVFDYGDTPVGALEVTNRILRGGNWASQAADCRSADRARYGPSDRNAQLGFRLAKGTRGDK